MDVVLWRAISFTLLMCITVLAIFSSLVIILCFYYLYLQKFIKYRKLHFYDAKVQHRETRVCFLLIAGIPCRRGGRHGANCIPAVGCAPPLPSPREPEIPFGRSLPPSPVIAVTSVSAIPFRQRSLAKRNGARRRTNQGKRRAAGRIVPWPATFPSPPVFSPLFPECVAPFRERTQ